MRYKWKVFLAMLVVSMIPLLMCGVFYLQESKNAIMENLMQTKEAQVIQAKQELEGKVQVYEHITDYLLSMSSLQDVLSLDQSQVFEMYKGYTEVVDPMLETNRYYHPVILQMTIYLKDVELEHGTTIAPYDTLIDKDWYQEAFPDGEASEKWIISTDPQMVYYVRPINRYGKLQAVLVTRFDYEEFLGGFESLPTYEGEVICLVKDGKILYSTSESAVGRDYTEFSEEDYLYQRVELEDFECGLCCAFPRSAVSDSLINALNGSVLLQILCTICAAILSLTLARSLVRRITALTGIVRKIGEKQEDEHNEQLAQLKHYNGPEDEIGVLIRDIEHMVQRLNDLKIEVYKEKIARRDLEMKALQAQINPHFLYNSLSIINWKAIEADADDVSSITLKLAEFYRTTLNRGSSIIAVEGEIRNIRSYLDIQLIMHDDNFKVEWEIDESVMQWQMPKLVLQPLVENALEHGLDLKEDEDRQLWLRIVEEDGYLLLVVADNGVGMTQEKADSLIHYEAKGYGVKNVKERIALLYGDDHVFRIRSKEGEGTEIYIKIPKERRGTS